MYLKLALRNAKRSAGDYLLFMITLIILAAIMELAECIAGAGRIQAGFRTESLPALITLVLVILTGYMNGFMLRQRAKELATYLLLGMERNRLSRMFAVELWVIGGVCLAAGSILGAGIYLIFFPGCVFPAESLVLTLLHFGIAELVSVLPVKRNMDRLQIREIMTEKERSRGPERKLRDRRWGLLFMAGFLCVIGMVAGIAFLQNDRLTGMLVSIICIPLAVTVISFYQWLFLFLARKRREKSMALYRGNRLYLIMRMTSGCGTNAVMNSVLCMCLLFSAMSFLFGVLMLRRDVVVFSRESQQWMGFLQICLSLIFIVIYFITLSMQQIVDLRQEARELKILYDLGKTEAQLGGMVRKQILLRLSLPAGMCMALLLPALPFVNSRLNQALPGAAGNVLVLSAGLFVLCFFMLYLCYFCCVSAMARRYIVSKTGVTSS